MTKEEAKQYIRNQIDSSIKRQDPKFVEWVDLFYNKSYIRALKLSKINGQPVNKNDFKGGVKIFIFNTKTEICWYYPKIRNYLKENYSIDFSEQKILIEYVLNEYEEYNNYNVL